ncbi:hypothetical protein J6590_036557, partial [Homalodisca vitripennis]
MGEELNVYGEAPNVLPCRLHAVPACSALQAQQPVSGARQKCAPRVSAWMLIRMKSGTHTDLVEYEEDVVQRDRTDQ